MSGSASFKRAGVRGKSGLPLPDAHAVGRREVEFVSGLDIERRVPCVEVAHRGCPKFVRLAHPVGRILQDNFP